MRPELRDQNFMSLELVLASVWVSHPWCQRTLPDLLGASLAFLQGLQASDLDTPAILPWAKDLGAVDPQAALQAVGRKDQIGSGWVERWSSGWWQLNFFIFTPKIGEDEPILTSIFFKGVVQPPTSDSRDHVCLMLNTEYWSILASSFGDVWSSGRLLTSTAKRDIHYSQSKKAILNLKKFQSLSYKHSDSNCPCLARVLRYTETMIKPKYQKVDVDQAMRRGIFVPQVCHGPLRNGLSFYIICLHMGKWRVGEKNSWWPCRDMVFDIDVDIVYCALMDRQLMRIRYMLDIFVFTVDADL